MWGHTICDRHMQNVTLTYVSFPFNVGPRVSPPERTMKVTPSQDGSQRAVAGLDTVVPALAQTVQRLENLQRQTAGENGPKAQLAQLLENARRAVKSWLVEHIIYINIYLSMCVQIDCRLFNSDSIVHYSDIIVHIFTPLRVGWPPTPQVYFGP